MEPIILKNKDFRTVMLKLYYPIENNIEDLANRVLLSDMLEMTSADYPTIADFDKAFLKHSLVAYSCRIRLCGEKQAYFVFSLTIPDVRYYGKDVLEEAVKFLTNTIYKPNVKDGVFEEALIEKQKAVYEMEIKNSRNNVRSYSRARILDEVDNIGYFSRNLYHNEELITKANGKTVYNYYQKTLAGKAPIVFAFGDVDEGQLKNILNQYLYIDGRCINSYENHPQMFFESNREEVNLVTEVKQFSQSTVNLGYIVQNMRKEDIDLLNMVSSLLSNQSSYLLHKKLRNEKGLVYMTGSTSYYNHGVLVIVAFLNKHNIEEAIMAIKETIEMLSDEDLIAPLLQNVKDKIRINLEYDKDSRGAILEDYINNYMAFDRTGEEIYESCKNITTADIKEFVKRLKLDTIYCLEGLADE